MKIWYERVKFDRRNTYGITFYYIEDNKRQYFHTVTARLGNKRKEVERLFWKVEHLILFPMIFDNREPDGSFDVPDSVLRNKTAR